MTSEAWDKEHAIKSPKYPDLDLVRFMAEYYYQVPLPQRYGIKVLDVGCGSGTNLKYLMDEGFYACGIDSSEVAINEAKKRLRPYSGYPFMFGDFSVVLSQIPESSFDCIIDIESIYSNKQPETLYDLVRHVLKPGGLLFSKAFATGTWPGVMPAGTHYEIFTQERIRDILKEYASVQIDLAMRTLSNMAHHVNEWLIVGKK